MWLIEKESQRLCFYNKKTKVCEQILFGREMILLQPLQILLPLNRHHGFFHSVTTFTGGNKIIPGGLPPSGERQDMIHSQFVMTEFLGAVITNTCRSFLLPPPSFSEVPGLGLLPSDLTIINAVEIEELIHQSTNSPRSDLRISPIK